MQREIKKNTHGGFREGARRPTIPKEMRKKQIVIGIEQKLIKEWGGLKKLQKDIKEWIYFTLKMR